MLTQDIADLTSQLTLEEKASLCSGLNFWYLKGVERLGIPSIMVTDGPHGLRKQTTDPRHIGLSDSVPATCFPTASAMAATWNRDLIREVGQALGEECRQERVGVILGPGVNIKRSPLCGRNFEYFSEDPYLTGEIAQSHISGVQSQGIGTSLKHFAANNQEYRRMTIDAILDERTLREIYLTGFEIAVKRAQPWTVMSAYNKVNGTYCSEHDYLMNRILKQEWEHQGLVMSDWGAMNDRVAGLKAGVELEMPGVADGSDAEIVAAVRSGHLAESVLDHAVERILSLISKAEATLSQDFTYDAEAHHMLARKVASEGVVLLKNEGHVLPLAKTTRLALIGRFAKTPRYQGAGSSIVVPTHLENLYDEVIKLVGEDRVTYAPGYTETGELADEDLIGEALKAAGTAEAVVVCAGLPDVYETEGVDRKHMKLPPGQDALIQRITAAHSKVVVVLSNGAPVEMPWVSSVACIVEGYLGGQAGAGAIADIVLGEVNPSGKLAETFPFALEDTPSHYYFPGGPVSVEYRESLYIGYRYYDTAKQDVLFPFGHGLSYTEFEYRDLSLQRMPGSQGEVFTVSVRVRNTGSVAGKEVVQLYVRDVEATAFRPEKELKGFAKVELQPGEETTVAMDLDSRAFAYYDTHRKGWWVEGGDFDILVGASSKDIRLVTRVSIDSHDEDGDTPGPERETLATYYNFPKGKPVSQPDFEALLGRSLSPNLCPKRGSYTINTPILDMSDSFIGRRLYAYMSKQMHKMLKGQEDTPYAMLLEASLQEMPLRRLLMMGNGSFSAGLLESLVAMMNGKLISGLVTFLRARRATSRQ